MLNLSYGSQIIKTMRDLGNRYLLKVWANEEVYLNIKGQSACVLDIEY